MANIYAQAARLQRTAPDDYPGLLDQIAYAVHVKATAVLAEDGLDKTSKRAQMAEIAYNDPATIAPAFTWPLVDNPTVSAAMMALDPIKDDAVLWVVGDAWDRIAESRIQG